MSKNKPSGAYVRMARRMNRLDNPPYAPSRFITNQRDLRRAFWRANPTLVHRKYNARGEREYPTDTRCAFVDWIDSLCRDGTISQELAQRATLD